METQELIGGRIRTDGARLLIDYKHRDEMLTSVCPFEGPRTFQGAMGKITAGKLLRPTTAQTLSLIDFALNNPDNGYCQGILLQLKRQQLFTATENLWGKEDVILYDNVDGTMPSDRKSLLKRMKDGDKAVRLVPYGFKSGAQVIPDFVRNSYIIGQVRDKDFAEDVVARVARKISSIRAPYLDDFIDKTQEAHRYTWLDSDWVSARLVVIGTIDDKFYGSAFGLLPKA